MQKSSFTGKRKWYVPSSYQQMEVTAGCNEETPKTHTKDTFGCNCLHLYTNYYEKEGGKGIQQKTMKQMQQKQCTHEFN